MWVFFFVCCCVETGEGGEKINVLGAEKEGEMKEALGCLKKNVDVFVNDLC